MVALTIGMATYNDFDGVYVTLQTLRLYQDLRDTELLVVDSFGCEHTKEFVQGWAKGGYIVATKAAGTAALKDLIFREASGEFVLYCDPHVLFAPGVIGRLKEYYYEHPECLDLLQGPRMYDDLQTISTHFDPDWRAGMWGTPATDPRGEDANGEPFDIPMQDLGVFSCRKRAWLGFNPAFRGCGGDEGYIHEKFRRASGRCLCLPWLRWMHRFERPASVPDPATFEDRLRHYITSHVELGLDLTPVLTHFSERLPEGRVVAVAAEALWGPQPLEPVVATCPEAQVSAADERSAPTELPDGSGQDTSEAQQVVTAIRDTTYRRAIVCFVGDKPHLIQQALALRHSWLYAQSPDTDLVMMGPARVLARLPNDVVKIDQRSVEDDQEWHGYHYADSITCMNGAGAEQLDRYTHLLRTDVDTFITPAWNDFHPTNFMFGNGGYSNDDEVRQRLQDIAAQYGLVHRGLTNINSTWYGPTEVVRRASAFNEMLMKHILTHYFSDHQGEWPGWYRWVASLYAGEVAVNHCAPDAQRCELLDASCTSQEPLSRFVHIHCWHTDEKFSKHAFRRGEYTFEDAHDLDLNIVRDYCMALSFRSLCDLDPPVGSLIRSAMERPRGRSGVYQEQAPV